LEYEGADARFAVVLELNAIFAEEIDDLILFEVDTLDLVIDTTTVEDGPIDDAAGAAARIAHVFLLEHFGKARAGFAVLNELIASES
jgi:hypothetical protein